MHNLLKLSFICLCVLPLKALPANSEATPEIQTTSRIPRNATGHINIREGLLILNAAEMMLGNVILFAAIPAHMTRKYRWITPHQMRPWNDPLFFVALGIALHSFGALMNIFTHQHWFRVGIADTAELADQLMVDSA